MVSKQQILAQIPAIAKKVGRAPSLMEFVIHTGTPRSTVLRLFPRWNDAIRAAGFQPNRLRVRPEDRELLEDWGNTVRRRRGLPSRRGYRLDGNHEPRTLEKRFGSWRSVARAFKRFAKDKPEWADVVTILSIRKPKRKCELADADSAALSAVQRAPLGRRVTYGNPIDFPGMRHEPINEQGVVLLFGMMAKELGFLIEAVQNGFPDCEAKRQISSSRWERVRMEFEFESRNFRDHGHPADGCDIIVCWRHNWPDCPPHLEVIEIASAVKSLTSRHEQKSTRSAQRQEHGDRREENTQSKYA